MVVGMSWLMMASWTVTLLFGGTVIGLGGCWWLILRRTIRRFNVEDRTHD